MPNLWHCDTLVARDAAWPDALFDPAISVSCPFTGRQLEILALSASGRINKQIARELGISERTVRSHCANMHGRVGAIFGRRLNHVASVALAISSGWVACPRLVETSEGMNALVPGGRLNLSTESVDLSSLRRDLRRWPALRKRQIAYLFAAGYVWMEIASILDISYNTVKSHVSAFYERIRDAYRLEQCNEVSMVVLVLANGWAEPVEIPEPRSR